MTRSVDETLPTHRDELIPDAIVDRPDRFVLRVRFDEGVEPVHVGDPGASGRARAGHRDTDIPEELTA